MNGICFADFYHIRDAFITFVKKIYTEDAKRNAFITLVSLNMHDEVAA